MPSDLESLLNYPVEGPVNLDAVLSSVARLSGVNGAVLAEVERLGEGASGSARDFVRLDDAGRARASFRVDAALSDTERAVAELLLGSERPGLVLAGPRDVLPLCEAGTSPAAAISALSLGKIYQLLEAPGQVVVAGSDQHGQTALWLIPQTGAARALPVSALKLSDWRAFGSMSCMGNVLFVAVADPVAGGEVYRFDLTEPSAEPVRLLVQGAQRFALNAVIAGMLPHPRGLLLGTAALAAPKRAAGHWGPELLLLLEDGNWDMIVGQPRFSPSGLILPASGMAPGMGNPANAAIRAMHSDGMLTVIALQDHAGPTVEDRRRVHCDLTEYSGALRLYASFDLEEWTEIPHNLPPEVGAVTSLLVTESTLFVGHEALGADVVPVSVVPLSA